MVRTSGVRRSRIRGVSPDHVVRCAPPSCPRLQVRTSGVATSSGAHFRRRHVFRVRSFPYVIIYSRSRTARGADLVSRNRVGIMQFYYWNCAITACNSSLIVFFVSCVFANLFRISRALRMQIIVKNVFSFFFFMKFKSWPQAFVPGMFFTLSRNSSWPIRTRRTSKEGGFFFLN